MRGLADLPAGHRQILAAAQEIAREIAVDVHLVGGPVRDLELGRPVDDLDLVLDQRAEELVERLARRLDAGIRSFPQFLTWKLTADGLPAVDVATARAEVYPLPGALPIVRPASLSDDLARRDFTINAIALDIRSDALIDPFDGLGDLRAGRLRALHAASFRDDPTRIFRALRLAARLDFDVEPATEDLLDRAVAEGALETVSRERIWREIELALAESRRGDVVTVLWRGGALRQVLGLDERPVASISFDRLAAIADECGGIDRQIAFLAMLLRTSTSPSTALDGSGVSARRREQIIAIAASVDDLVTQAVRPATDRERLPLIRSTPIEAAVVAAALDERAEPFLASLRRYRELGPAVRGDELGVPLGAHVGLALQRTRDAIFLGDIEPSDAVTFARSLALQYLETGQP
ncbi:MAG TPA: hypothetical protein VMT00_14080 [Thermoanaerobaculia bacterium]|nr:hypothetical protein [Thermoanaerobaculia bacterium]